MMIDTVVIAAVMEAQRRHAANPIKVWKDGESLPTHPNDHFLVHAGRRVHNAPLGSSSLRFAGPLDYAFLLVSRSLHSMSPQLPSFRPGRITHWCRDAHGHHRGNCDGLL
jgi:hypothetical protein